MMAQNGLINFSFWDAAWGIKLCKVLAITINWHQCFLICWRHFLVLIYMTFYLILKIFTMMKLKSESIVISQAVNEWFTSYLPIARGCRARKSARGICLMASISVRSMRCVSL